MTQRTSCRKPEVFNVLLGSYGEIRYQVFAKFSANDARLKKGFNCGYLVKRGEAQCLMILEAACPTEWFRAIPGPGKMLIWCSWKVLTKKRN